MVALCPGTLSHAESRGRCSKSSSGINGKKLFKKYTMGNSLKIIIPEGWPRPAISRWSAQPSHKWEPLGESLGKSLGEPLVNPMGNPFGNSFVNLHTYKGKGYHLGLAKNQGSGKDNWQFNFWSGGSG